MPVPDDPFRRPTFGPAVFYKDPFTALEWLAQAFGFERSMLITNPDGTLGHAEMTFGDGYIMVGSAWASYTASPESTGGKNTQILHVHLDGGIDAHCARARAAGAAIVREPNDEFYGDRVYSARDPEGHVWTFAQLVRIVSRAEAEKASGLTIDSPGWK
jgi:uncharacterized glyoxalase superfamily protein PhnB